MNRKLANVDTPVRIGTSILIVVGGSGLNTRVARPVVQVSDEEHSDEYWAQEFLRICSENPISPQERERRERAAQRLKEVYSSIPWYKEQGEKDGDEFWRNLQSKAVLAD